MLSQIKSKSKHVNSCRQHDIVDLPRNDAQKLVKFDVKENANAMDSQLPHGFLGAAQDQHTPAHTSIRYENQDFITCAATSKIKLESWDLISPLPRFETYPLEFQPAHSTSTLLPIISCPSSSLINPFESHRLGAPEDASAAFHDCSSNNRCAWPVPAGSGAIGGDDGSSPRTSNLSSASAAHLSRASQSPPLPPPAVPPADDPFHGDWPHW